MSITVKQLEYMIRGMIDEVLDKKLASLVESSIIKYMNEHTTMNANRVPMNEQFMTVGNTNPTHQVNSQAINQLSNRVKSVMAESYADLQSEYKGEQFAVPPQGMQQQGIPMTYATQNTPVNPNVPSVADFANPGDLGKQSILNVPTTQLPPEVANALTKNYGPLLNRVIKKR